MKISLKNLQNLPICFKAKERKKKKKKPATYKTLGLSNSQI